MSSGGNTVNVKGISHETTEKEVRDVFSFWYVFTCCQSEHQHSHTNTHPAARSPTSPSHPSPKMRPASHTL